MKEHDVFSMSDLDDSSVEEIAEKVNALTDSDKDRIFADCMSKMNIAVTETPERNITVKRSGIRRFMPFISAAACILIIAGVLFRLSYSSGFKSDTAMENTASVNDEDSYQDNSDSFDSFSGDSEASEDVGSSQYDSDYEDNKAALEDNDEPAAVYDYSEIFSVLISKFDLANAVVSNDPFEHENDYMYEKNNGDAVYQYYRITDSRISSVSDVEKIVKEVFSEDYYTVMCSELTEGEYPMYEENEDGLFTRAAARGWEFEWTDDEPEITGSTENSFTVRKLSMFMGQEPVMFDFRIIREEDGWKIDSYSKDTDR